MKEAINRIQLDPKDIDDVIYGNCLGEGGNAARRTLLEAEFPVTVTGLTIDRQCGSSINSVALAADLIRAGRGTIFLAGGVESMSRSPHLLSPSTRSYDRQPPKFMRRELSSEKIGDPPMGITAENLAEMYNISRKEQDYYAEESQRRMEKAVKEGFFEEQIVPIEVKIGKKTIIFNQDEHPRPGITAEQLSILRPVFKEGGSVTAGNSSGVNDGASAVIVMSMEEAERRGLGIMARIVDSHVSGVDPNIMGIGPVPAVQELLERNNLVMDDIDFVELNEAFAAQVLACNRELKIPLEKLNVNGGAISHGHPIAATGGMLIAKAVYEMKRSGAKRAIVTACIGGGQGIALLLEK